MTAAETTCRRCGVAVDPVDAGPLKSLSASIGVWCDTCSAREDAEVEARERSERDRAQAEAFNERLRRSGLPERHTLKVNELEHDPAVVQAAAAWVRNGGGLVLTGSVGTGKTTVAGAAARACLRSRPLRWTTAPLLAAQLAADFGSDQRRRALEILSGHHALVLDDIDKTRPTEAVAENMFLAIDQRVEHGSRLLVTSNLRLSQLAERWPDPYGEAIVSRLHGYCTQLHITGLDRRARSGS